MDPNVTFKEMNQAIAEGREASARVHAKDLKDWLDKGGFYPAGASKERVDACINSVLNNTAVY